jgi:site-specific DNA recombinase
MASKKKPAPTAAADIRAVLYARISDDPTGMAAGVTRQLEDCRRIVADRGWAVAAELIDNDVSASRYSRKRRDEWAKAMEMIDGGQANALIAYDLDRMLRRYDDLHKLIELADNGMPVVTVQGDIRLDTSDGRFVAGILVAKAAKESDDISRRVRRVKEAHAAAGDAVGAVTAFGWARTADRSKARDPMRHDPVEAKAIQAAVHAVLNGMSVSDIAREWNAKGYQRPLSTKTWSSRAVRAVLMSPRNAGLLQYQGEILRTGNWPAIIERDTYEKLRRRLNADTPGSPRRRSLFTGFLYCSLCGSTLRRDKHTSTSAPVWRCKKAPGEEQRCGKLSAKADAVESFVVAALLEAASEVRPVVDDADAGPHEDIVRLEDELRDLATDAGAGRITRAEWFAFRDAVTVRLDDARGQIARASRHRVQLDGKTLTARWPSMTMDEQRSVLAAFIDKVNVLPALPQNAPIEDRLVVAWKV